MKNDSTCYLYVIVNKKNKKKYIGVTNSPTDRWEEHKKDALIGDKPLNLAIRDEGVDNFFYSILSSGPRWVIFELERALIALWKTQIPEGYNIAPGGEFPFKKRFRKRRIAKKRK